VHAVRETNSGRFVYLDHAATTPLAPEVRSAMAPYLDAEFGNASGAYRAGRKARSALEDARARVAACLGCLPGEVVFTSGGTESDNLALRGAALRARRSGGGNHLIVTAVEHKAVLSTAHDLAFLGFDVTVAPADRHGQVAPATIASALRDDTFLVSAMLANNEVGTVQPVAALAAVAREAGALFHTDAVQAAAWLDVSVNELGVDLMSLSAHKFYGPKGVGILYVRQGSPLDPCQTGGGQEHGLRCGTENVAGAVGAAAALELCTERRRAAAQRAAALRDAMIEGLCSVEGIHLTGSPQSRLPGHVSVWVSGAPADALLLGLDMRGIAASSGSACSSGRVTASHVLAAMGYSDEASRGALRLSMGHSTTEDEVRYATAVLSDLVVRFREVVTA
jgi:cysteine desulfurase